MLSMTALRGLGVIPEDRPQAKVEAVTRMIRPHKQSWKEWDDVAQPRNNDDKITVTPEFIQEAYIGQMSPSMELKNLMSTVMAIQQQRPTCQTSSRTGPTTTGPPTRIEVQPGPPTSGILRSQSMQTGDSSYTEDAVTNLLAEARGGREAVHVDPLDTREQELLQELGHSARMPIGSTRPHVTLPGSGAQTNIPNIIMPRVIPKVKAKPKLAPATGAVPRRTSLLPAFTRLNRAELEQLATQWDINCNGLNMAAIQDRLFLLDTQRVQGHHQGGSQ